MMFLRRFFKLLNNQTTAPQLVQGETMADELHNDVQHLEQYGFTSAVPDNVAHGVIGAVNGQADHLVLFGYFDTENRPILEVGEVAVYAKTDAGISTVTIKKNGDIVIKPASGKTIVDSNLEGTGWAHFAQDVTAGSISLQGHTHGGVVVGGGITGVPQ